ncbi:SMI1/KNR4 family protein [Streptomyces sp. NPDC050448]|uniref:SMI1/KNR4 family protein n=1 Tax=Streptomyces sp. NPDC050448 TaxID=3155404 RepID=UPI00342D2AC2
MTDDRIRVEQTLSAWHRIEAWLEEYAPRSRRRLPPPAAEEDIRAVERELDFVIPADVRAFYRLHNGTGPGIDFAWPTWDGPLPIPEAAWDPEQDPSGCILPDGGSGPLEKLALDRRTGRVRA